MKLRMPNGSEITVADQEPLLKLQGLRDVPVGPPEPVFEHHRAEVEATYQKALKARGTHIEIMAAAFLKEVGEANASKYELVEEWGEKKITWHFEKRVTASV